MICMTVTSAMTYMCPMARIVKKPARRMKVHSVRTLKLTTFLSRSSCAESSGTFGKGCCRINLLICQDSTFSIAGELCRLVEGSSCDVTEYLRVGVRVQITRRSQQFAIRRKTKHHDYSTQVCTPTDKTRLTLID